jgi:molybdopterin molybdotransferase
MTRVPLLAVEDARRRILAGAQLTATEPVDLLSADGRVLAEPLTAQRTQPPFDVSAMDGFAVRHADIADLPATLRLIGESAAGHRYDGAVNEGEAVRIFTGAPVPQGADAIVIQENTEFDADTVRILEGTPERGHIRITGFDFTAGQTFFAPAHRLNARDITLAAALGHARLNVRRKPTIALIATGDELVLPGEPTGPDQIICSNPFGLAAMVHRAGGQPKFIGIARDDRADLAAKVESAKGADILTFIGGASVGDHDLVGPVLEDLGMRLDFWRVGMRPGKPLMYGRLGDHHILGLPGNPVSSMITTRIFLVPLIQAMLGLTDEIAADAGREAHLTIDLAPNGPREHYMRAISEVAHDGTLTVTPVRSQDSSLLTPLSEADLLIVRPANDPAKASGDKVKILPLDF